MYKKDTLPSSNFCYASDLTEMILVGVLSQRFKTLLKFDSPNMQIINQPDLNTYLKELVRAGWSFDEKL
jgi:hypothetical protein